MPPLVLLLASSRKKGRIFLSLHAINGIGGHGVSRATVQLVDSPIYPAIHPLYILSTSLEGQMVTEPRSISQILQSERAGFSTRRPFTHFHSASDHLPIPRPDVIAWASPLSWARPHSERPNGEMFPTWKHFPASHFRKDSLR